MKTRASSRIVNTKTQGEEEEEEEGEGEGEDGDDEEDESASSDATTAAMRDANAAVCGRRCRMRSCTPAARTVRSIPRNHG